MIHRLDRIEQRATHTVRWPYGGGLHVPHAWYGTELLQSVSRGWLGSDPNPVCSPAVYLAMRQETLNGRNIGRRAGHSASLEDNVACCREQAVVTLGRPGTPVCYARLPEAPTRPEHVDPTARPPNRSRQNLYRVEGTLVGPCEVLAVQMNGRAGAVRR
jgi:hypothetical protein